MLGALQIRVGIQNGGGISIGSVYKAHIAEPLSKAHGTEPTLSRAEHIARATQAEIFFGYLKPVERTAQHL
jgi:hypothetical protein